MNNLVIVCPWAECCRYFSAAFLVMVLLFRAITKSGVWLDATDAFISAALKI